MNTATTPLVLNQSHLARRNALDWLFAAWVLIGGLYAFSIYHNAINVYEKAILLMTMSAALVLGWFWRPLRLLIVWLNYAAWLHLRLMQGLPRGTLASWWAWAGLGVTPFVLIGVKMCRNDLHGCAARYDFAGRAAKPAVLL